MLIWELNNVIIKYYDQAKYNIMITEYAKLMDGFYVVKIYVKIRDGLYAVTK